MRNRAQARAGANLQYGRIFLTRRFFKSVPRLLRRSVRKASQLRLSSMASSLAFTTVLSIAPLLAVLFYVFQTLGGLQYGYDKVLPFLLDNLSEGTGEVVTEHLGTFIRQVHANAVGWAGAAGLLLTTTLTYLSVVGTFNRIWEVTRARSVRYRIIKVMTLLSVGPVLMTASIALTTAIATRLHGIPLGGRLLSYALSFTLFAMVYALVPMVHVPLRVIFVGSLIPAALWETAKYGYAIYTHRMVTYSAFYGSFAAIPLFLLWIYIAWTITLFGGVWVKVLQDYFETEQQRKTT